MLAGALSVARRRVFSSSEFPVTATGSSAIVENGDAATTTTTTTLPPTQESETQPRQRDRRDQQRDPNQPKWKPEPLLPEHLQRNADLVEKLRGKLILAPLTKGNNLPFRRLCADFGADVTVSEMAFARNLIKGDPKEKTRLRRADNEKLYCLQFATNVIDEGVKAALMAAEAGADFVDLNCGCPIHEATRRGLGSALLRKPEKLARLVAGISSQIPIPMTVKIRTGQSEGSVNVQKVVEMLTNSGAAAVIVHGRSALQRYKKPADWGLIETVARNTEMLPVIGNGDIFTHYEATRRMNEHGCLAVMVGRGALIKPWIFQEAKDGKELVFNSAADRVGIYRTLVSYMKEHFGDDERGRQKAFYFLPFHLEFFCRHRPLPEEIFGTLSLQQPLISTRWEGVASAELGETLESLPILERLLRCENPSAHQEMAAVLWDATSDAEAVMHLERLAAEKVVLWEEEESHPTDDRDREGGGSERGGGGGRRRRDDRQTEG